MIVKQSEEKNADEDDDDVEDVETEVEVQQQPDGAAATAGKAKVSQSSIHRLLQSQHTDVLWLTFLEIKSQESIEWK